MSSEYASAMASAAANTVKETVGAQIVSKTLDTVNKTGGAENKAKAGGDMAASYDLNKSVLSSVYSPKGAIAELKS